MEWLACLLLIVLMLAAFQRHRKNRKDAVHQAILRRSVADRECGVLLSRAERYRAGALRLPPYSAERLAEIAQARHALQRAAKLAAELSVPLASYEAMLSELDAIAGSSDRWISPRSQQVPNVGSVVVAFVDTETTGLGELDEALTLGIVLATVTMPKGQLEGPVEHLYEMRKPHVPIHPRAQAVHGLSMNHLEGRAFDMPKVREMIERADVLVAHNAKFDRRMLSKLLPEVSEWPWRCSYRQAAWPRELQNKRLDTICEFFSIARAAPHNALSDAKAMADCLLQPTGKTARSRTYLAACLVKPNF